jgi:hypothetical protein
MAVVQGIKEKVHLPIYDSLSVDPEKQLRDVENSSTLKFFVNVQGKTKLETNLQSASLLPHYNTFEARAMRVVISDLPPEFSDEKEVEVEGTPPTPQLKADVKRVMELLEEARDDPARQVKVFVNNTTGQEEDTFISGTNTQITFTDSDLEGALEDSKNGPAREQIHSNNGAGTIIGKFIYNTVTTLYVGEKIMMQMPTWFFPAGAGPYSETGKFATHGEPDPMATFRFAEPLFIDKQQNFRVEIEIPDSDTLKEIQKIYGPFIVWLVLDGYMTRGVQ